MSLILNRTIFISKNSLISPIKKLCKTFSIDITSRISNKIVFMKTNPSNYFLASVIVIPCIANACIFFLLGTKSYLPVDISFFTSSRKSAMSGLYSAIYIQVVQLHSSKFFNCEPHHIIYQIVTFSNVEKSRNLQKMHKKHCNIYSLMLEYRKSIFHIIHGHYLKLHIIIF